MRTAFRQFVEDWCERERGVILHMQSVVEAFGAWGALTGATKDVSGREVFSGCSELGFHVGESMAVDQDGMPRWWIEVQGLRLKPEVEVALCTIWEHTCTTKAAEDAAGRWWSA